MVFKFTKYVQVKPLSPNNSTLINNSKVDLPNRMSQLNLMSNKIVNMTRPKPPMNKTVYKDANMIRNTAINMGINRSIYSPIMYRSTPNTRSSTMRFGKISCGCGK